MNSAGRSDHEEAFWTDIEGNWDQFKGKLKETWGKLTDDDLTFMEGRRDRIVGRLKERYSDTKMEESAIENELRRMR